MLYSCCSLSAVYYLFTAYTERAFLPSLQLFKQPLRDATRSLLFCSSPRSGRKGKEEMFN
ncbi:hypothetical protein FD723_33940 (plasmid) [Nostoc sp. C052]|nr:hypothetical protein FD723_33940 [Nostoc sp. C052]